MNKLLKMSLLLCLPLFLQAQLKLNNNGAIIKVNAGTDLRVNNGSIENTNAGSIDNNGKIYLDETFNQITAATYMGGATSWLWFEGSTNQNMTGDAPLNIARLRVDNSNRLIFGNDVNVSTDVDLMLNGNIELGNFDLNIASGGNISNYDAANYIITNGTGYLQQEVAAVNTLFPVGNSRYNPATLSNLGTTDNFQIRVEDQVLDAYPAGNPEIEGVVGKVWFIDEEVLGGSDVNMSLQWETGDELPNFDRTVSGISRWDGSAWDPSPTWINATTVGATSWTQSRANITTFSPFAVEDLDMDLPIELLSFDANRIDVGRVDLDWATATELNNAGFWIERMLDNESSFSAIAWLDGQGNSQEITNYAWTDNNAHQGVSYYRLRQEDFDGTTSFSMVRAVEGIAQGGGIVVFPNPTEAELNIRFGELAGQANLQLFAADGKLILSLQEQIVQGSTYSLDGLRDLPAGMYLLRIQMEDGFMSYKKIIIERN